MAEFCLECWNKINGKDDPPSRYIISKDLDTCECCGEWKNIIIVERDYYYLRKFRVALLAWAILTLPYSLYKRKRAKKDR